MLAAVTEIRPARRLLIVLSLCLAALASALVTAPSAQARVPSCRGLPRQVTGSHAWLDNHSERSQLVVNIDRLVCSAADRTTIDIKSWFIKVDGPAMRHLLYDLKLMTRYHHVRVRVVVGQNWSIRAGQQAAYRRFLYDFRFAQVTHCLYACQSSVTNTSEHSKWIAVPHLRTGGSLVLSMSGNLTTQQFRQGQTGIAIVRNTAVFNAFAAQFRRDVLCARGACQLFTRTNLQPARWYGSHGTNVYFTPISNDAYAEALSRIRCTGHHFIQVASLAFARDAVAQQLVRLRHAGCTVRVLLEHAPTPEARASFRGVSLECEVNHDKTLIIDASRRVVFSGAEDFVTWARSGSANQTVRTISAGVIASYESFYRAAWRRGARC